MIRVLTPLCCICAVGIASITFAQTGKPRTDLPDNVQQYSDVVYANYGQRALHLDLLSWCWPCGL